ILLFFYSFIPLVLLFSFLLFLTFLGWGGLGVYCLILLFKVFWGFKKTSLTTK
ncbi:hypothetical protein HMPREF1392_00576, partial [Helicobacter pylori GAM101Biv]